MGKIIHETLSRQVIGVAMDVLNELKPGLDEKLYERPLVIGLRKAGYMVDVQKIFPVFYREELIGELVPDLVVDNAIILDPKVVSSFSDTHVSQMIGYMAISGLDLAILLNFKNAKLEWKRVVRQEDRGAAAPDLHA